MTTQEASIILSMNGFYACNQYDPATGFTHEDIFIIRNKKTGEIALTDVTGEKLIELAKDADTGEE